MKKIIKTAYVAEDGKEFVNEEDCKRYEKSVEVKQCISKIAEYCDERSCTPLECIFYKEQGCIFNNKNVVPMSLQDSLLIVL